MFAVHPSGAKGPPVSHPSSGSPFDPPSDGGTSPGSQHSAPNFGGGQTGQQHGAPQYTPAGGGMPQYTPAGGGAGYGGSPYSSPQQGGRRGKGRPPLWIGLVTLGLSLLVGLAAIIVFVMSLGSLGAITDSPSGDEQTLQADTEYHVYSSSASSVEDCTVYSPGFDSIDFTPTSPGTSQTATVDGEELSQLGTFTTAEEGAYRLSCTPYVDAQDVYVSDVGVGGALGGAAASIGLALLGGLLFVVGLILIIVNRVSASKNRG